MSTYHQQRITTGLYQRRFPETGTVSWMARHAGTSRSFDTRAEAEDWLAERRETPRGDRVELKPDMRLTGQMLHALLDQLREEGSLADSTIESRRKVIDAHLGDWLRKHKWTTHTVTHKHFARYLESVEPRGPSAYNNALKMIMVLGRELKKRRFRQTNPVPLNGDPHQEPHFVSKTEGAARRRADASDGIATSSTRQMLMGPGGQVYMPDWGEVQQIIGLVQCGPLYNLWYRSLALTGCRPSELAGVQWGDVEMDDRRMWIIRPLTEQNGTRYFKGRDVNDPDAPTYDGTAMKRPKDTGRFIPIGDDLQAVLSGLTQFKREDDPRGWLFCGRMTKKARNSRFGSLPISYEWAQNLLRQAMKGTKWEGIRQYDLRHHYASRKLSEGKSLWELSKLLGTSMSEVETTYGHVMEARDAAAHQ